MKIVKYLSLVLVALFAASCEEHVVEYKTQEADGAFVQIHYFVPLAAKSANYIYKLEIGDNVYVNNNASVISTYSGTPYGSVGKWYNVPTGKSLEMKMYKKITNNDKEELVEVYNNNIPALEKGVKYNIFVHDFAKEPLVIEHGEYKYNVTQDTDTSAWIKFINLIYESGEGDPTNVTVQYQYQYTLDWETKEKSEWLNMGNAVAFGENTGWVEMPVIKQYFNSTGYARIDYRALDAATGEVLQYMNANEEMVNYSDYWNAYVGRRYLHIMAGTRTSTTRPLAVTQWECVSDW